MPVSGPWPGGPVTSQYESILRVASHGSHALPTPPNTGPGPVPSCHSMVLGSLHVSLLQLCLPGVPCPCLYEACCPAVKDSPLSVLLSVLAPYTYGHRGPTWVHPVTRTLPHGMAGTMQSGTGPGLGLRGGKKRTSIWGEGAQNLKPSLRSHGTQWLVMLCMWHRDLAELVPSGRVAQP